MEKVLSVLQAILNYRDAVLSIENQNYIKVAFPCLATRATIEKRLKEHKCAFVTEVRYNEVMDDDVSMILRGMTEGMDEPTFTTTVKKGGPKKSKKRRTVDVDSD